MDRRLSELTKHELAFRGLLELQKIGYLVDEMARGAVDFVVGEQNVTVLPSTRQDATDELKTYLKRIREEKESGEKSERDNEGTG